MSATTKNQLQDTNNDFIYDAAGNLTQAGAGGPSYVYDAENRLTSAGGVTYTYDGDGNRVMKSNGTIYWYGANDAAIEESDLTGNLQRFYYFFNGQRLARQLTNNEIGFYMTDYLGNVRYLGGSATGYNIEYYPFGGIILNSDIGDDRYQFSGKERDSESNLDNFGARFDSSQWGRFMSPDDGSGRRWGNPQSLNLYSYVLNNPVSNIDPTGHDCVYLNNGGNRIESIDQNSNSGECGGEGGYWVNGTVTFAQINSDAGTVDLTGTTNGSDTTSAHYQDVNQYLTNNEIKAGIIYGVDGRRLFALNDIAGKIIRALTPCGGNPELGCQVIFPVGAGGGSLSELMASRPAWAATPGGFVNWLKNISSAGKVLTAEEADAIVNEAKSLGVEVRLDPPHPGTNWNVTHLNIGSSGQVHLEVPIGYTNPGAPLGHP